MGQTNRVQQALRTRLVAPSLALEAVCRACEEECAAVGESFLGEAAMADWPAYIAQCAEEAEGRVHDPARVPQTVLLLTRMDDAQATRQGAGGSPTILGVAKVRHTLTPALEDVGGHIGYAIRPSERGKGYGTRILALTLERARDLGLSHVLLTCDTANTRSARVILRNGGVLTSEGYSPRTGARVSRYWIALREEGGQGAP